MKLPQSAVVTPAAMEEAIQRLADAHKALTSIQKVNRHDIVLNEHGLHMEKAAKALVAKRKNELAHLKANARNRGNTQT